MPYVTVPKDLTKVKSKVLFNLTKRQLICFSLGLLIDVPLYFAAKEPLGNSSAAMLMILTMLPAFLFALYEKNGQHLEVIIRNMIRVLVLRPKKRPYKTNNFYAVIARQDTLDKEVYRIHNRRNSLDCLFECVRLIVIIIYFSDFIRSICVKYLPCFLFHINFLGVCIKFLNHKFLELSLHIVPVAISILEVFIHFLEMRCRTYKVVELSTKAVCQIESITD